MERGVERWLLAIGIIPLVIKCNKNITDKIEL